MQVRSLGGEDPLEEEMAGHSSVLAWRSQGQSMGLHTVRHDWGTGHAHMPEEWTAESYDDSSITFLEEPSYCFPKWLYHFTFSDHPCQYLLLSLKKKKKKENFYFMLGRANEQCCDSFSWTAMGLSHTYTCIHSPLNFHSIQATTKHWAAPWDTLLVSVFS